ncbi:hypothetical protein [Streptomyces sp. NPDC047525]|uniref:hypothetical protein n=1 Tax=Streptomyces sp. NPDC047525 TaxID=3155264 RepID=UPI0033D50916
MDTGSRLFAYVGFGFALGFGGGALIAWAGDIPLLACSIGGASLGALAGLGRAFLTRGERAAA